MKKKIVILLSGKINSGKNQFAEYLNYEFNKRGLTVTNDLFAKDLKDYSKEDFRVLGGMLKKKADNVKTLLETYFDPQEHGVLLQPILKALDEFTFVDKNFYEDKTDITRVLLQLYGTEIARRRFDDKFWVKKTAKRLNDIETDVVVVTDVRFPNEIDDMFSMLDDCEVIPIRINRNMEQMQMIKQHASELALDDYGQFHYIIDNNDTLDKFRLNSEWVVNDLLTDKQVEVYQL